MREDGTPERAHGKVLWHVTMSVDGFIGRDDAMDWVFRHDGWTPAAQAAVNNIGAILAGRRLYDLGISSGQGKPYGGTWTGPILVLTHRPSPPPNDPSVAFVSNGIDEAVATALRGPGAVEQPIRLAVVDLNRRAEATLTTAPPSDVASGRAGAVTFPAVDCWAMAAS